MQLKLWINKWAKLSLLSACLIAASACSHRQPVNSSDISDANAAYRGGAQTAGLGEESRFGDQIGGSGTSQHASSQILSKRLYYFDFDSNVVHEDDKPAILANAEYLLAHPNKKILVEGHTDPRGSREYNIGLGERRAKAVVAMLMAKGVNPNQIRVVSYGAQKLAVMGHTETEYKQDRRVFLAYS